MTTFSNIFNDKIIANIYSQFPKKDNEAFSRLRICNKQFHKIIKKFYQVFHEKHRAAVEEDKKVFKETLAKLKVTYSYYHDRFLGDLVARMIQEIKHGPLRSRLNFLPALIHNYAHFSHSETLQSLGIFLKGQLQKISKKEEKNLIEDFIKKYRPLEKKRVKKRRIVERGEIDGYFHGKFCIPTRIIRTITFSNETPDDTQKIDETAKKALKKARSYESFLDEKSLDEKGTLEITELFNLHIGQVDLPDPLIAREQFDARALNASPISCHS